MEHPGEIAIKKGVPIVEELTVLVIVFIAVIVFVTIVTSVAVVLWKRLRRNAQRAGYSSVTGYLRSTPGSDREKREAVDLALIGLVLCFLGLMFPPLLLIGLFPLFYGTRKIVYSAMGLGLVDDAEEDQTSA